MRGQNTPQDQLFSYVSRQDRIAADHPVRKLRAMVDGILDAMSEQFAPLYSDVGRVSILPEQLFRALLLQILYTVAANADRWGRCTTSCCCDGSSDQP